MKKIALSVLLAFGIMSSTCTVSVTPTLASYAYVGAKTTHKFHLPSCRAAKRIKKKNRRYFKSAKAARKAGYKPCGICTPR